MEYIWSCDGNFKHNDWCWIVSNLNCLIFGDFKKFENYENRKSLKSVLNFLKYLIIQVCKIFQQVQEELFIHQQNPINFTKGFHLSSIIILDNHSNYDNSFHICNHRMWIILSWWRNRLTNRMRSCMKCYHHVL